MKYFVCLLFFVCKISFVMAHPPPCEECRYAGDWLIFAEIKNENIYKTDSIQLSFEKEPRRYICYINSKLGFSVGFREVTFNEKLTLQEKNKVNIFYTKNGFNNYQINGNYMYFNYTKKGIKSTFIFTRNIENQDKYTQKKSIELDESYFNVKIKSIEGLTDSSSILKSVKYIFDTDSERFDIIYKSNHYVGKLIEKTSLDSNNKILESRYWGTLYDTSNKKNIDVLFYKTEKKDNKYIYPQQYNLVINKTDSIVVYTGITKYTLANNLHYKKIPSPWESTMKIFAIRYFNNPLLAGENIEMTFDTLKNEMQLRFTENDKKIILKYNWHFTNEGTIQFQLKDKYQFKTTTLLNNMLLQIHKYLLTCNNFLLKNDTFYLKKDNKVLLYCSNGLHVEVNNYRYVWSWE